MKRRKSSPNWQAKKEDVLAKYRDMKPDLESRQAELEELILKVSAAEQFAGKDISWTQFGFVLGQMMELGLEGYPYIHARTYEGWRAAGRQVRKGEKSVLTSIAWVGANRNQDGEATEDRPGSRRLWPKTTNLFHVSQTDAIAQEDAA